MKHELDTTFELRTFFITNGTLTNDKRHSELQVNLIIELRVRVIRTTVTRSHFVWPTYSVTTVPIEDIPTRKNIAVCSW